MKPFRIMFICSGNICRSPLAHAVFEHLTREAGVEYMFEVESSGTSAYHVGEEADSRMRQTASRHGIRLNHRSRQLFRNDLAEYDLLLPMDSRNFRETVALCRTEDEQLKVKMFRDFDPEGTGDVPDPWYGGMEGFETVWSIVKRTSVSLLDAIRREPAA